VANVYSRLLYAEVISPAGVRSVGVDAGDVWVIRDIEAWCDDPTEQHAANGFRLSTDGGTVIWEIDAANATTRTSYRWNGHQVMEDPDTLFVTTIDDLWSIRVSGYKLTLP